jgi:ADP-heptose:LPS heptosyltransferase
MKKDHILVIRFSALGDIAMTVPVVYSLATQYPHVRITVLSRPVARPLFENLAPNVNFMQADVKREYHGVKGLNKLYRRLAAKQFTHVADMHNVLRSDYLRMRFNLGRYHVEHINKHRSQKRKLTSYNNKVRVSLPSTFQNYADVLAKLGFPVKLQFHSIFGQTPPLAPTPPKIGIAPTAAHKGKVYPFHLMRRVIDLIIGHHPDAQIFLFGRGQLEDGLFEQWCNEVPQCINVATRANGLRQELELMSQLNVMITMDSANLHLASLTATPVVSVWGATSPETGFMGWNQPIDNCIQIPLDCRPCSIYGNRPCRKNNYECLYLIEPQRIVDRVEDILLAGRQQANQ